MLSRRVTSTRSAGCCTRSSAGSHTPGNASIATPTWSPAQTRHHPGPAQELSDVEVIMHDRTAVLRCQVVDEVDRGDGIESSGCR